MNVPLLDTHAWVWWIHGDTRLGRSTLVALDDLPQDRRPAIAAISLWEVATLVERGRLILPLPLDRWLEAAADPRTVQVLPITPTIAVEVARLPTTFHRDPADRLIVATSRVHDYPIVTHDRVISRARLAPRWQAPPLPPRR